MSYTDVFKPYKNNKQFKEFYIEVKNTVAREFIKYQVVEPLQNSVWVYPKQTTLKDMSAITNVRYQLYKITDPIWICIVKYAESDTWGICFSNISDININSRIFGHYFMLSDVHNVIKWLNHYPLAELIEIKDSLANKHNLDLDI